MARIIRAAPNGQETNAAMKHKSDSTRVQRPADKKPGKKLNKNWLHSHVNDPYVQAAQKDGYRARAAYKLKEIDEAFGLIRPGLVVVDLGCAPGAWSQYLRRRMMVHGTVDTHSLPPPFSAPLSDTHDSTSIGLALDASPSPGPTPPATGGTVASVLHGTIVALDLLPMQPIEGVQYIQGDFRDEAILARLQDVLQGRAVDIVVSDMAPNLSGHSSTDAARVAHLIELAVDFASHHLKPNGTLVAKVFHGPGYDALVALFKAHFRTVRPFKPKSSRDKSSETFLIGVGLK